MIKDFIQKAYILKTKGYYKHAIEAFYKALEIDNSSLELLLEIAECYYLIKDEERALNYVEEILSKSPTHINALKFLKKIFIQKSAWLEAEQAAKNIFAISNDINDLVEILHLLNKQKHFQEVFEYNFDIENSEILYEKAYAKLHLDELNDAIILIDKAISFNNNSKNLLLKSKILYKMNQAEYCAEILDNIEIDENDVDFLNFLGIVKQFEGKFKESINYFLKTVKLEPQNHQNYYNCASTYFKMGDIQKAKKFYNLAISLAPDNKHYHFALANLYYSEKHYKRAMEELDYDFFEAKLLKSIILYDSGYLALAKKEFDKLIVEQPENELIIDYKNRIDEELKL